MNRALACLFVLGAASASGQGVEAKGKLSRHLLLTRVTRACPSLEVNASNSTLAASASRIDLVDNFSCDGLAFSGPASSFGRFTFDLPRVDLTGRAEAGAVHFASDLALEFRYDGIATLVNDSPSPRIHNAWVDIDPDASARDTGCERASVARRGNITGQEFDLNLALACKVRKLPVTEVSPGKLEARLVTRLVVEAGHVDVRCCSERGGRFEVTITSVFEFEAATAADRKGQEVSTSGRIPIPRPERGDPYQHFTAGSGPGLDTACQFGEEGDLVIRVPVTRYVGEVNADGTLKFPFTLVERSIVSEYARLRLAVFDVDATAPATTDRKPETDLVEVNGNPVMLRHSASTAATLDGADSTWSLNDYAVPVRFLKFPARGSGGPPEPAMNEIRIRIDTANPKRDQWCTAADWASLSVAAMAPVVLIHGAGANSSTWDEVYTDHAGVALRVHDAFEDRRVPYEYRVDLDPGGSIEANGAALLPQLQAIAQSFGTDRLHLVGHDKGATDARGMFAAHAGNFLLGDTGDLAILSLFALGTASRGTVRLDLAQEAPGLLSVDASALIRAPNNAILNLTQPFEDAFRSVADWAFESTLGAGTWTAIKASSGDGTEAVRNLASSLDEQARQIGVATGLLADPHAPPGAWAAQTSRRMAEFNSRVRRPPWIRYYSIAGDADRNGSGSIDEPIEIEGYFRRTLLGFVLPSLPGDGIGDAFDVLRMNVLYQAIGNYQSFRTEPRTTLFGLVSYRGIDVPVSTQFRPNDLFVAEDSVHCTDPCGFTPVRTLPLHHEALKSYSVMRLVIETLQREFPLPQ